MFSLKNHPSGYFTKYIAGEFLKEVFGNCSVECGTGTRIVTKIVCKFNPEKPESIEKPQCTNSKEEKPCQLEPCPVIYKYGFWSEWNECSKTCKKGLDDKAYQIRTRTCTPANCNFGNIGKLIKKIIQDQRCNEVKITE